MIGVIIPYKFESLFYDSNDDIRLEYVDSYLESLNKSTYKGLNIATHNFEISTYIKNIIIRKELEQKELLKDFKDLIGFIGKISIRLRYQIRGL